MQTLSAIKPDEADVPYIGIADRKSGGIEALALAVGSFWANIGAETLDVLSYVQLFSPSRHWAVPRLSSARINRRDPIHPLLGTLTPETGVAEWRWRNFLRVQDLEWMDGHQVQSQVVFPATGYLAMALEAACIVADERLLQLVEIRDLTIDRALTVPDNSSGVETLFTFYRTDDHGHKVAGVFTCQSSLDDEPFHWRAFGRLEMTFGQLAWDLGTPVYFTLFKTFGVGSTSRMPNFQILARGSALSIHPATLDTGLQAIMAAMGDPNDGQLSGLYLPTRIASTIINPSFYLAALGVTGPKLIGWLRGQVSIMEELRRDDLLTRFYQDFAVRMMTCSLADVVSQLSFRYPRMKILEVGAGTGSATREVLDRTRRDYHSYTYTDISAAFFEEAQSAFETHNDRFIYQVLNLEWDPTEQGFAEHAYDLIIASNVLHATRSLTQIMAYIRRLLKPGGRVAALEITNTEDVAVSAIFGTFEGWWLGEHDGRPWGPMVSKDTWNQVLQNTGFGGLETVSPPETIAQTGLTVFSAQAIDDHISKLQHPLSVPATGQYSDLILVGGSGARTARLVTQIRSLVAPFFARINHAVTLEAFVPPTDASEVAVLVLSDMDSPCLQGVTAERLHSLQPLFGTARKLLWTVTGKPGEQPYQAMTKGLLRTLASENPHALLQHLTIDDPDVIDTDTLATTLMRLVHTDVYSDYSLASCTENPEWELRLENGIMMIPRVLASRTMNRRLFTSRGFSSTEHVDPLSAPVKVVPDKAGLALVSLPQQILSDQTSGQQSKDIVSIRVHYATLSAISVQSVGFLHLVLGQDQKTRMRVVALSVNHGSVVSVPASWCLTTPSWLSEEHEAAFLGEVATAMVARHLVSKTPANTVLLLDGAAAALQESVAVMASTEGIKVRFITGDEVSRRSPTTLVIPPHSSSRAISRLLPAGISVFTSFRLQKDSTLAQIKSLLPPAVATYGLPTFYGSSSVSNGEVNGKSCADILAKSCLFAEQQGGAQTTVATITPGDIQSYSSGSDHSVIVNWLHSGPVLAYPLPASSNDLSAYKTYLLVGMTGDLGRSVCHWMITRGARCLVLTSRSPNIDPLWLEEMSTLGARVLVMAILIALNLIDGSRDVSDRTSVLRVHNHIQADLPPVGGVVNAAMVLQDGAFAQATLDDVTTVLKPKVEGSKILDELYQDDDLDFFILMGSVAGIIGNFNQSIYAATSVFVEELALQRRLRGQVGSVIHPGEVHGVGYVARLGAQERDNLARIIGKSVLSERDLLEQFSEAILAGRPDSGRDPVIIGGIPMADPEYRNPVLWPFVHYFRQSETVGSNQEQISTKAQLQSAASLTEAADIIATGFSAKVRRKLQLPLDSDLPGSTLLSDVGVDSLIAVDLRVWFLKELGVDMPVLKLLGGSSIDAVVQDAIEDLDSALLPQVQA
ncbi:putative PKS/NRPS-like protein biosynthetic cluster [Aspergillus brasiliensis]|nr:putative PKS/NRPS-like protein biosynthetic cluster [Aspergillus brasiliensis]